MENTSHWDNAMVDPLAETIYGHSICLWLDACNVPLITFWASLLGHMAPILALGFNYWVENPCDKNKFLLVVGGTWTQVLADSMAIAASDEPLHHIDTICASAVYSTYTLYLHLFNLW